MSSGDKPTFLKANRRWLRRGRRLARRYGFVVANLVLVMTVGAIVWQTHRTTNAKPLTTSVKQSSEQQSTGAVPLDTISAADIATNVAYAAQLPQADNVRNQADSATVQLSTSSTDDVVLAKPQIVQSDDQSVRDIIHYTTQPGDTVPKLASEFNISSNSIKWSNNLTSDALAVGRELVLPPRNRNGIVYKVKAGDTIDSIATKYKASKDKIISFNDAEVDGIKVDQYIFIPDGEKPADPVISYASYNYYSSSPVYAGNGYSYGYCTYWVAKRRAEIGKPIPSNWGNADTWDDYARAQGYVVDKNPEVGAIVQAESGQLWYIYHVAFIEEVRDNGDVVVSQMNVAGWNVVSRQVISADAFQRYAGLDIIH